MSGQPFLQKTTGVFDVTRPTNCTFAILFIIEKIYLCSFIPNCTRNRVITKTNTNPNFK